MTERSDNSTKRSGPLGISGGSWRLLIIPVLLCMILPLGASAFMFRNDTAHTGIYSDGGTHPNNVLFWNYSFGGFQYDNATEFTYIMDNSTYASPTVINGVVYEGSLGNNMTAFDATTGAVIRNFQAENDIHTSAAVVNNVVYFTSYDHNLYALSTTDFSTPLWTADIGAPGHSSPAVVNNVVYVGSDNGKIFAFNAANGNEIWNKSTNSTPTSSNTMHSSPAVVNNVVYIGNENGNVSALNATNGAFIWNKTTGGYIQSSPAVVGNVVYIGSSDGNLYALDAATGTDVWSYATGDGIISSPAVANGIVYIGSNNNNVYAIDAVAGTIVSGWPFTTGDDVASSPSVANGIVYVGSNDGKIYAIYANNGSEFWHYTTQAVAVRNWIYSSPSVANGVVYIGGGEGNTNLYAIGNQIPVVTPPVAAFTPSTTSGTAPLVVTFTDTSSNTPTAWNWSFRNVTGNNTQVWFSTAQSPARTFGVGNFSIVLNASNSGGYNISTQVTFINVTAVPTPVTNATATTGVYRPGAGFYLKMDNLSTWTPSTDVYLAWDNAAGDFPIAGDWNADGRTETGVYRPGAGFYLKMDNSSAWAPSTDVYLAWDNANGDLPIAGKFV